nr:iAP-3 [Menippe mercenaria nudivirus]
MAPCSCDKLGSSTSGAIEPVNISFIPFFTPLYGRDPIHSGLISEYTRLSTFFRPPGYITLRPAFFEIDVEVVNELARLGFYNTDMELTVQCTYCGFTAMNVKTMTDLRTMQDRHSGYNLTSQCPTFTIWPNIPLSMDYLARHVVMKYVYNNLQTHNLSRCKNTAYMIDGSNFIKQLDWPPSFQRELEIAGFQEHTLPNVVMCKSCGLGLHRLCGYENPLLIHAAFSPSCGWLESKYSIITAVQQKCVRYSHSFFENFLNSETLEGNMEPVLRLMTNEYSRNIGIRAIKTQFRSGMLHLSCQQFENTVQSIITEDDMESDTNSVHIKMPYKIEVVINPKNKPNIALCMKEDCCDPARVMNEPCRHVAFCKNCALLQENCPLCDTPVAHKQVLTVCQRHYS